MTIDIKNNIYVISAPSGVGKTTLIHKLIDNNPDKFMLSISHTSRAPRGQEKDGLDYHFVTEDFFTNHKEAMLETATVHGNIYGTSMYEIERIKSLGRCPLLEIDVQGVAQVIKKIPVITIFVLPPTLETMWLRLEGRATDDLPTRWKRLCNAHGEIAQAGIYSHFLINDKLDLAYNKLASFILEGKDTLLLNKEEGLKYCKNLMDEFNNAPWIKKLRLEINGRI